MRNQPYAHFGEWFTAIHYWKEGYRVLIEKYVFQNHPKACSIAKGVLGEPLFCFLREHAPWYCQPPDLLVYRPDLLSHFFVEVKLGRDRLRPNQEAHFKRLEEMFNQEIRTVKVKQST